MHGIIHRQPFNINPLQAGNLRNRLSSRNGYFCIQLHFSYNRGMKDFSNNEIPWYVAGLAFECQGCGRCCSGPEEGYVWATPSELDIIAGSLNMTPEQFAQKYVRKVGRRLSLIEDKKTKDCIFLKKGRCTIYEVRPTQCRTWPFWQSNIDSPDDWAWAGKRCAGINRGKKHNAREIENLAKSTNE